ncbi:hypothetical protein AB1Y20_022127 [Prymnesium parvum]|uniref:BTB domain-containing protein n=1 Tax=Prymnesium parvum TaxID=97485 RepID=A0AB34JFG1_PRYPA
MLQAAHAMRREVKRKREASPCRLVGGHALPPAFVEMWRTRSLCDLVIVAADQHSFHAHRVVLAAGSDYMAALVGQDRFADSSSAVLHLSDVCAQTLSYTLDFIYQGHCEVPEETSTLCALLQTAMRLQVRLLVDVVVAELCSRLQPDNCLELWRLAEAYARPGLAAAARDVAARNFSHAVQSDEALRRVSEEQMAELLALDRISVSGEATIFETLVRWVQLQPSPPAEEATWKLLSMVRFPTMSAEYLRERVLGEPLLTRHAGAYKLLLDAFVEAHYGERSVRTRPRVSADDEHIYVIGGLGFLSHNMQPNCSFAPISLSAVEKFDTREKKWSLVRPMLIPREYLAAAVLDRKVYVCGGQDDVADLACAERYDPVKDEWTTLPPMATPRSGHALVELNGLLYAIGGYDGETRLNCVERFNPATNLWTSVAPFSTCRNGVGAVALAGKIYAAGGVGGDSDDDDEAWCSMECYDPMTDQWSHVRPMKLRRAFFGMAALDGKLYISGGVVDDEGLSSVEAYDPITDEWTQLEPMLSRRSFHAMVAFQGKLYVFCGKDYDTRCTRSCVEVYDPATGKWEAGHAGLNKRRAHVAVAC